MTILPELPVEIFQEIVTISAYTSYRQAASLARVSHLFNHWTHPILHRVCVYHDSVPSWPGPYPPTVAWFENHVKYIYHLQWGLDFNDLQVQWSDGCDLITVLRLCPNLQGLALWVDIHSNDLPALRPALSTLSLQRLSINPFALFASPHFLDSHAQELMFRSITHLEIFWGDIKEWEAISGVAKLPILTHLALCGGVGNTTVSGVIQSCKQLMVVILVVSLLKRVSEDTDQDLVVLASAETRRESWDHPRVVAFNCQFMEDWEVGATGGSDMWIKAEEIVEARLKEEGAQEVA